jgi:hypothetical protein
MKLRVAHYPQIPCKPFTVEVNALEEALLLFNVLADYDLFQYNNRIKPDYSNATTLEYWDEDEKEWLTWYDEDGYEIEDYELKNGKAVLKEN